MVWILAGLAGAGLVIAGYASLIEQRWYALRRHRVPCLPSGSKPLRIVHLSDLHFRPVQKRKARFLRGLASLKPDIVIGTGDFLGDPDTVPGVLEALDGLRGSVASLFVLGSNDYYAPVPKNPLRYLAGPSSRKGHGGGIINPWRDLVQGLQQKGWELIANRTLSIGGIDILGLDDPHIGKDDLSLATPRTQPGFRLAIAHSPDPAFKLAELGYDLIVAGHTHGGQLRIPGLGAVVTNTKGLPRRMARGLHKINGSWLHVSAGLGTSKYAPFRFACRPEVCVLELEPV
ncbi:MAG: metallophosphoesterase [Actinomycetota bacterium]|nr:metallophosphoesterase [Actinomycetota bacterium]